MKFIKLSNGVTDGHPIELAEFSALFPSVSLPSIIKPEDISPLGFGIFDYSEAPSAKWNEIVVEVEPSLSESGVWRQSWEVRPATDQNIGAARVGLLRELDKVMSSERFKGARVEFNDGSHGFVPTTNEFFLERFVRALCGDDAFSISLVGEEKKTIQASEIDNINKAAAKRLIQIESWYAEKRAEILSAKSVADLLMVDISFGHQ